MKKIFTIMQKLQCFLWNSRKILKIRWDIIGYFFYYSMYT